MATTKASSSGPVTPKKRLTPFENTVRELMFASGGRCAICKVSLFGPSGGWIGTIAHIVAAEDGGPRGDPKMNPEDRRKADNLMLLCATHGREVDDRQTGESRFPVQAL